MGEIESLGKVIGSEVGAGQESRSREPNYKIAMPNQPNHACHGRTLRW